MAKLQTAMTKPCVQDLLDANALVKYVSRTKEEGLVYKAGAMDFESATIVAIQDASYAGGRL